MLPELTQKDLYNNNRVKLKFIPLFQQFIMAAEKGEILTKKKRKYSKGTLRAYKLTLTVLEDYQERNGIIFLNDITPYWAEMFYFYLQKYDICLSTASMHISRVKAVLNRANKAGLTLRTGFGISTPIETSTTIFNSLKELKKMMELDLSKSMEYIRDIYVMNCFLGMRFSDLMLFLEKPNTFLKVFDDFEYIDFRTDKTTTVSVIPVGLQVKKTLDKWREFRVYSGGHFNSTIKKIGKNAGIDTICTSYRTIGGKKMKIESPKWRLMSNHTARRTFASLCVLSDMNQQNIMKMTGHTTEQSFQKYVRVSHLKNAMKVRENEFFKIKL
ncbi:MAG: hypothetical protein CSA38_02020 [Flavobacteriales bacterium]|nr:MAG: hypothetical protein CSA38_02020 [Flavobacteriales bacterium]